MITRSWIVAVIWPKDNQKRVTFHCLCDFYIVGSRQWHMHLSLYQKKKRSEVWSSALVVECSLSTNPSSKMRNAVCISTRRKTSSTSTTLRVSIRANCCRLADWAFKNHWTSCQIEPLLSTERGVCMCEHVRVCVCECLLICRREVVGWCVRMIWLPSLTLGAENRDEYDPWHMQMSTDSHRQGRAWECVCVCVCVSPCVV